MQQIHIRVQNREEIDERADELGFASRAEYLRHLIRQDLRGGYR